MFTLPPRQDAVQSMTRHCADLSLRAYFVPGAMRKPSHNTLPVGDSSCLDNSCSLFEHLHLCFQVPEEEKSNIIKYMLNRFLFSEPNPYFQPMIFFFAKT